MLDTTFLRFIAILLITNTHLDKLYPVSSMATGGQLGNSSCCRDSVSLGCVEGLNNTIRAIQGTACGFREEGYLSMKIITHFLSPLPDYAKITHSFPSCPFV